MRISLLATWLVAVAACLGGCKSNQVNATNDVCEGAFQDCDRDPASGCETNTTLDVNHCGACGRACPSQGGTPSCVASECKLDCSPGFADCDGDKSNGCETDLRSSLDHCGACGALCAGANASGQCVGGACQLKCATGFADCNKVLADGCEQPTNTLDDCGACGASCRKTGTVSECVAGACKDTACESSFHACAGTCSSDSSPTTCGTSCEPCTTTVANAEPTCESDFTCGWKCSASYSDCGGTCLRLKDDPKNCGACGTDCEGGTCVDGVCAPRVLATAVYGASEFTVGDNYMFYKTSAGIMRLALDGKSPPSAFPIPLVPSVFRATADVLVYPRHSRELLAVKDNPAGGTPTALVSVASYESNFTSGYNWQAAQGKVFWIDLTNPSTLEYRLKSINPDGTGGSMLTRFCCGGSGPKYTITESDGRFAFDSTPAGTSTRTASTALIAEETTSAFFSCPYCPKDFRYAFNATFGFYGYTRLRFGGSSEYLFVGVSPKPEVLAANASFLYTRQSSCAISRFPVAAPATTVPVPYYDPKLASPNCGTFLVTAKWNYFYNPISGEVIRLTP